MNLDLRCQHRITQTLDTNRVGVKSSVGVIGQLHNQFGPVDHMGTTKLLPTDTDLREIIGR